MPPSCELIGMKVTVVIFHVRYRYHTPHIKVIQGWNYIGILILLL